jgi:hypothetical protein
LDFNALEETSSAPEQAPSALDCILTGSRRLRTLRIAFQRVRQDFGRSGLRFNAPDEASGAPG